MAERGGQSSVCVALIIGFGLNLTDMPSTESYDHMEPVGVDPRWDAFGPFHDYLLKAFPLVYVSRRVRIELLITSYRLAVTLPCR